MRSNIDDGLSDELSMEDIFKLFFSQWKVFCILGLFFGSLAVIYYVVKVPYTASSTIVIHDSQNSSLQAFSNQYFGFSKSVQESKKGSSLLSKHIEYLKTREFFESFLASLAQRGNSSRITLDEKKGFDELRQKINLNLAFSDSTENNKSLSLLNSWVSFSLSSDFEIKATASTPSRGISLFLANAAAEVATELLRKRELEEIKKVETFMTAQMKDADSKLLVLSKELSDFQSKDENYFPMSAQNKMGEYLSDLMVRANENQLKIAENRQLIEFLTLNQSLPAGNSLYGVSGRVNALKSENQLLLSQQNELNKSIELLKRKVKELPFASQRVEDIRKMGEVEFNRYKELSTAITKLGAMKISIDTRFEVLELARLETSNPNLGLIKLLTMGLVLGQLFGSLFVYIKYLWNPGVASNFEDVAFGYNKNSTNGVHSPLAAMRKEEWSVLSGVSRGTEHEH